jgi:hypothetical protein
MEKPLPDPLSSPHSFLSSEGGLIGLPLRASNEGLLRPRVARAQETNRLPTSLNLSEREWQKLASTIFLDR